MARSAKSKDMGGSEVAAGAAAVSEVTRFLKTEHLLLSFSKQLTTLTCKRAKEFKKDLTGS